MFVYLDESGDTGFKFPNSSRYFVIALLLIEDPIPFHAAIEDLRRTIGIRPWERIQVLSNRRTGFVGHFCE